MRLKKIQCDFSQIGSQSVNTNVITKNFNIKAPLQNDTRNSYAVVILSHMIMCMVISTLLQRVRLIIRIIMGYPSSLVRVSVIRLTGTFVAGDACFIHVPNEDFNQIGTMSKCWFCHAQVHIEHVKYLKSVIGVN